MIRNFLSFALLVFVGHGRVIVSPHELTWDSATNVNEFTVVLDSKPSTSVIVKLGSTGDKYITLSACSVSFTEWNWNIPQKVGMLARPTYESGFNAELSIFLRATSEDGTYSGLNATVNIVKSIAGSGQCISWGDPHYTNFGGQKFDFQGVGDYYMVRAKDSSLVVQTRQAKCSARASCNGGVAVKYYDDVIAVGIDDEGLPILAKRSTKSFSSGFKVSQAGGGSTIIVSFPEGSVTIEARYWRGRGVHMLDVNIQTPQRFKSENNAEGLCLTPKDMTYAARKEATFAPPSQSLFNYPSSSIPMLSIQAAPSLINCVGCTQKCTQVDVPEPGSVWHSKYWRLLSGDLPSSPAEYIRIFHELEDNKDGYCKKVIRTVKDLKNRELCGSFRHFAFHISTAFTVLVPGKWCFRFGADLGLGGALYVDGRVLAWNNENMWWARTWRRTDHILKGCLDMEPGEHQLSIYGGENCCDGEQRLEAMHVLDASSWPKPSEGVPPDEDPQSAVWSAAEGSPNVAADSTLTSETRHSTTVYSNFPADSVSFTALSCKGQKNIGLHKDQMKTVGRHFSVLLALEVNCKVHVLDGEFHGAIGTYEAGDTFKVKYDIDTGKAIIFQNGAVIFESNAPRITPGDGLFAHANIYHENVTMANVEYTYSGVRPWRVWSADNFPLTAEEPEEEIAVAMDISDVVEEAAEIFAHDFGPAPVEEPDYEPNDEAEQAPFPRDTETLCTELLVDSDLAHRAKALGIDTTEYKEDCEFDLRETQSPEAVLASGSALLAEALKISQEQQSTLMPFFEAQTKCRLCYLHGTCIIEGPLAGTCQCEAPYSGLQCSHNQFEEVAITSVQTSEDGQKLIINGKGFFPEETHYCVFGTHKVAAQMISASQMICDTPEGSNAPGVAVTGNNYLDKTEEFLIHVGYQLYHNNGTLYLCRTEAEFKTMCFKNAGTCEGETWEPAGIAAKGEPVQKKQEIILPWTWMKVSWSSDGITMESTLEDRPVKCHKPLECACPP